MWYSQAALVALGSQAGSQLRCGVGEMLVLEGMSTGAGVVEEEGRVTMVIRRRERMILPTGHGDRRGMRYFRSEVGLEGRKPVRTFWKTWSASAPSRQHAVETIF